MVSSPWLWYRIRIFVGLNRRTGRPKFRIREMGSRYLFICLYIWLEKYFSRGDYRKSSPADE